MGLGQTIVKLGTKHFVYQKLENFTYKMGIYVNRLASVIFAMCLFHRPKHNAKGISHSLDKFLKCP